MRWSYSAHNCFVRCKRQYYFSNIAAWHNAKDVKRKQAYYLKQLTPAIFWAGNLVEAGIEDVIINNNSNPVNPADKLYIYSEKLAKDQMDFSLSNQFRNVPKTKTGRIYFRLFEHEYNLDDTGIMEAVLEDVAHSFRNYASMEISELNISLNDLLTSKTTKFCQQPVPISLFNSTIQCHLDCLIPLRNKVIIIDWKVSKTTASNFARQLKTYGLAVYRSNWSSNTPLSEIYVFEANLFNGKINSYPLTQDDIIDTEDFIFDSIKRIEALVENKKYNDLNLEDFPKCENIFVCQNCNFQKLCL